MEADTVTKLLQIGDEIMNLFANLLVLKWERQNWCRRNVLLLLQHS